MTKRQILFSLGSNCEPRELSLQRAVQALEGDEALGLEGGVASGIYESVALLPLGAPAEWDMPYLNMVFCAYSTMPAEKLLLKTKAIERALGRQDRGWWGPREIDIDILAIGDELIDSPHLKIPHAQMLFRDFVMIPLAEILPGWKHPKDPSGRVASDYAASFIRRSSVAPWRQAQAA